MEEALSSVRVQVSPQELILKPAKTYPVRPALRWAGGKASMASNLAKLMPHKWNRYIEPMSGGAALFFFLRPARAILGDINSDLIEFYCVLRDNPRELLRRLRTLTASRELYYEFRESRPVGRIQRATRFAYLNRLAWNGLHRVNRNGEFNVPIGDRLPEVMWDEGALEKASRALSIAELVAGDFRAILRRAREGDLVFLDPPYPRGCREPVGFNRYASEVFTIDDHSDLAHVIERLTKRSVQVMLTLADEPHLSKLYPQSLRRKRIRSKSLISCNGSESLQIL